MIQINNPESPVRYQPLPPMSSGRKHRRHPSRMSVALLAELAPGCWPCSCFSPFGAWIASGYVVRGEGRRGCRRQPPRRNRSP
ncbi:MAG: hypothetical protein U5L11_08320 [Arhodomonas sp.]|nr:hypothetical protein [Arhodomonas sp.]